METPETTQKCVFTRGLYSPDSWLRRVFWRRMSLVALENGLMWCLRRRSSPRASESVKNWSLWTKKCPRPWWWYFLLLWLRILRGLIKPIRGYLHLNRFIHTLFSEPKNMYFWMGHWQSRTFLCILLQSRTNCFNFKSPCTLIGPWMSSLLIGSHRVMSPASLRDGPSVFGQIIWLVQMGTSSSNGVYP